MHFTRAMQIDRMLYHLPVPQVYITWTGTDSHGLYFSSSASRFSRMSSIQLEEFALSRQALHAIDKI